MTLSAFCIRRPIFTILLMLAILVGGIAGYRQLSVSALPNLDFPAVLVTASLPGASPKTMAATVATPLERQFSTIAGVSSITSSSYLGTTQIILQFDLSRSLDGAALDVQSAITTATRGLPKQMPTPPVFQKLNPADQPIFFVGVSSDTLPFYKVNEYADTIMAQRISMLPGVAQVQVFGAQKYAVRVRVNPKALAARNLTLEDISKAIAAATSIVPGGVISGRDQLVTLEVYGQPNDARQFESLIVAYVNDAPVRLRDVAVVEDSVEDERSMGQLDGKKSVVLAIQRQPGSNTVQVVENVRKLLPQLRSEIPESITVTPLFDRSTFIKNSIDDVERSLSIAVILVVLVVFLFFKKARIVAIPGIAVPLSLIATYGVMALLGFSINNISLLALTLSVGFVVDDAIVMLENIMRYHEKGMQAMEAALVGAKEVGFTILSITFSLVAVFIPVLFMGGVVGRMFREFAVTISVAILISGLISLTLTPMMASKLLAGSIHDHGQKYKNVLFDGFDRLFQLAFHWYKVTLRLCLAHQRAVLWATLGSVVLTVALFIFSPKGFVPLEDTGFIFVQTEANPDVSFNAMVDRQAQIYQIVQSHSAVQNAFSGIDGVRGPLNSGRLFIALKPRHQRPGMDNIVREFRAKFAEVDGISVYMQPIQNLALGGRLTKGFYQYTLQGADLDELSTIAEQMEAEIAKLPGLVDVSNDLQLKSIQVALDIDAEQAQSLGITFDDIRSVLFRAFGTAEAGRLYTNTNDYKVIVEVDPQHQQTIDNIKDLQIRTRNGQLIELDAIAKLTRLNAPLAVNHQGQLASATISFNLLPGTSLGDAVAQIKGVEARGILPASVVSSFQGSAAAFKDSQTDMPFLLLLSILVVYIILGMLYESFIHPVTILSGLPSAGVGALLTLLIFGKDLDIIGIIGMILLVGIVKKNAIMMVDFAIEQRHTGTSPAEAIYNACLLRFRPIMMTTLAALFGTLPIALGLGEGAELRQPLGIAVVGGLFTSQLLTLYITPVIYLFLSRWERPSVLS